MEFNLKIKSWYIRVLSFLLLFLFLIWNQYKQFGSDSINMSESPQDAQHELGSLGI